MRSGGSYINHFNLEHTIPVENRNPNSSMPENKTGTILESFEAFNFNDNASENGGRIFIPPDPIGTAGTDRLIAVVNVMIGAWDKAGILLWREALKDFFAPFNPGTFTFDPKVIYDHYEDRFLVVTLERVDSAAVNPDPRNESRIFLAVSKTGTPGSSTSADWYYHQINAKTLINGEEFWADYPGLKLDEEAVYLTTNMFTFEGGSESPSMRLWILDKGTSAGFYAGGPANSVMYDPYGSAGIPTFATTTMPAQVYGATGAGPGIGTYLVSYSGLTTGGPGGSEFINIMRVNNPLGTPTFTSNFVDIGDIEDIGGSFNFPDLEDAPQLGTSTAIEVNDRRLLDCVWRNNSLWATTTITPNSGPDADQTTAHWIRINTSSLTLEDQGDIGGEDIASNTYTYYPSVAVNSSGDAKFGFSASSPSIYAGAFVTGRRSTDSLGTVQASEIVHTGEDVYIRTFGTGKNRWGDYSGIAIDPSIDDIFWVFNEYALPKGSGTPPEDGRWGTAWASCSFVPVVIEGESKNYPADFTLLQNYPNPFNPNTFIHYHLGLGSFVKLQIFDLLGREVRTLVIKRQEKGEKAVVWNGLDDMGNQVVSGIYFYRIVAGSFVASKKMILMK
jgi:hypothetical protein